MSHRYHWFNSCIVFTWPLMLDDWGASNGQYGHSSIFLEFLETFMKSSFLMGRNPNLFLGCLPEEFCALFWALTIAGLDWSWAGLDSIEVLGYHWGLVTNSILFYWLFTITVQWKKCAFYKHTIKVCVSCFLHCLGTTAPSTAYLTVSLILLYARNAQGEFQALEGCRVSFKSPSRVQDTDKGVAGRRKRE